MEDKIKYKTTGKRTEFHVQKVLCQYTKLKYPHTRFVSSLSGAGLSRAQRKFQTLRSHKGDPDWMLFWRTKQFNGLAVELKKEGSKIFKKDGKTLKSIHLQEQLSFLKYLHFQGFCAGFCIGAKNACDLVDAYMLNDLDKINTLIYPQIFLTKKGLQEQSNFKHHLKNFIQP